MRLSMIDVITSTKNPKIKDALRLMERRHRDETGLFLIEGLRELELAIKGGMVFKRLFYCEELFRGEEEKGLLNLARRQGAEMIPVGGHVFEKLAYREDSFGLVAVAERPIGKLEDITLGETPLLVVVEGVEKPGNLGAILRSADAAGVDGVIVCGKSTDIYNPNAVRASIGTIFTVPIVEAGVPDIIGFLKGKGIRIVATTPHTDMDYFDADLRGPCAIVMGSEHEGLTEEWFKKADLLVRIPMMGEADSLNLAVSTALLLYEAVRQRRAHGA
jgi:TrmH family RNA methyltransferase